MIEAASTSKTSVNFYQTTWRNIPEDSHLHTHCCENLKSHQDNLVIVEAYEGKIMVTLENKMLGENINKSIEDNHIQKLQEN
jgi:hypothetical protein